MTLGIVILIERWNKSGFGTGAGGAQPQSVLRLEDNNTKIVKTNFWTSH